MKTVDDLVRAAAELAEQGRSRGEISDELNVSRETASWLVERADAGDVGGVGADSEPGDDADAGDGVAGDTAAGTRDIHVDWSAIGRDSDRLAHVGAAMADLLAGHGDGEEPADLVVGVEKAGAPLATVVARELGADLATYAPRKHQWEEGDLAEEGGSFSRNFATLRGRECYVVDDTITSGTTMRETIAAIREGGGEPIACSVIADKRGVESLEGVPVDGLVQVLAVGGEDA